MFLNGQFFTLPNCRTFVVAENSFHSRCSGGRAGEIRKFYYSVMHPDRISFCGDVVLDSFNMAYRDKDIILDQIYKLKIAVLWIRFILILIRIRILGSVSWNNGSDPKSRKYKLFLFPFFYQKYISPKY